MSPRQGNITTNAGTTEFGGNGGNIAINAPNGFIASVFSENSDISANAYSGSGGKVNVTAQGIYGIRFRPQLTPFSDITASSTLGINGEVNLTTPNIDPSRGLSQLPVGLIDSSNKIDRRCLPKGPQRSSTFTVTGTGGIPTTPLDPLQPQNTPSELVPLPREEPVIQTVTQTLPTPIVKQRSIVEAQHIHIDDQGRTVLLASEVQRPSIAFPLRQYCLEVRSPLRTDRYQ